MGRDSYISLDLPLLEQEQSQLLSDLLIHSVGDESLGKGGTCVNFFPLHTAKGAGSPPKLPT